MAKYLKYDNDNVIIGVSIPMQQMPNGETIRINEWPELCG